ncbi:hypothetical protein T265_07693 [Opisthorchis viverrini]|uniref:Uncharacterized protein n=1 Tax=Opisthorchis viverrini TaxID=6198 RepID=A0A074ZBN9_OPIVI|nr:hypothetical protein T265_07693 [Opisthorchis viverrini]KER24691.1 hypothetical protein T265_07693 [Opisthorchis viverrini]
MKRSGSTPVTYVHASPGTQQTLGYLGECKGGKERKAKSSELDLHRDNVGETKSDNRKNLPMFG